MEKWNRLTDLLKTKFGIEQDLTSVLYLIGVQELGRGFENFSQEEKMDLIDMAKAKLLSSLGLYIEKGLNAEGWLIFEKAENYSEISNQNKGFSLHNLIVEYFENQGIL